MSQLKKLMETIAPVGGALDDSRAQIIDWLDSSLLNNIVDIRLIAHCDKSVLNPAWELLIHKLPEALWNIYVFLF